MRSNKIRWNQNKDQEKIEKFYRFGLRISSMLKMLISQSPRSSWSRG